MKRIFVLMIPLALLLAAAESGGQTNGPRAPETSQGQSSPQVNRHVDAHVPTTNDGESRSAPEESARRRPAVDPFRGTGAVQSPTVVTPPIPSATQPSRDRRY
jgi:hypothetical protein